MSENLSAKDCFNEFIFSFLMPFITSQACPNIINLSTRFKIFLCNKGIGNQRSEELSVEWMPALLRKLKEQLEDWVRLGVPYPCYQSDDRDDLFVTWRHPKYEELTGHIAISEKFVGVFEWLEALSAREFLLACAVYLKLLGATKIFITDGPNDGGIDLIAKIERSPFNSVVFFVQAKTNQNGQPVARDTVLMEYGKYVSLPHDQVYHRYRKALEIDGSADGASYCYAIFTSGAFHKSAKEISSKLGILLRSKVQIAYFLSQALDRIILEQISKELKDMLKIDLTLNVAVKITFESKI